ncbi:hypothetical protein SLEP1_g15870 [Rubroshorea leprosula]|uniref:Uncharacterized protein n=1 Tax=Rubroshorea leprosula TaxID=152421 RepID=A0AAV5IT06_9ROSI|nr:hypothetical protein SLEP1_g15870 [Rubroshorea leprosula]
MHPFGGRISNVVEKEKAATKLELGRKCVGNSLHRGFVSNPTAHNTTLHRPWVLWFSDWSNWIGGLRSLWIEIWNLDSCRYLFFPTGF